MPYQPRILLIETEPSLRHTLALILRQAGYAVTAAGHARDALRDAAAPAYDLIFLDVDQVERGNTDFLEMIRRLNSNIPTLILVASPATGMESAASSIEHRAILVKPLDPARMLACIRDLLARSLPSAT